MTYRQLLEKCVQELESMKLRHLGQDVNIVIPDGFTLNVAWIKFEEFQNSSGPIDNRDFKPGTMILRFES